MALEPLEYRTVEPLRVEPPTVLERAALLFLTAVCAGVAALFLAHAGGAGVFLPRVMGGLVFGLAAAIFCSLAVRTATAGPPVPGTQHADSTIDVGI